LLNDRKYNVPGELLELKLSSWELI
jgi:hypothetical protein